MTLARSVGWFVVAGLLATTPSAPVLTSGRLTPPGGPGQNATGLLEVDGKKNPELIPDYYVWAYFFRLLDRASPGSRRTVMKEAGLSATQFEALVSLANREVARDAACGAPVTTAFRASIEAGEAVERAREQYRPAELACRQKTLDASDLFLASLDASARASLRTWVDHLRGDVTMYIAPFDMQYYRLPR